MKIVAGDSVTLIYPYVHPDGKESGLDTCIVVWPDKTLKLLWADAPIMTLEAGRLLAKALEYAAGLAEAGRGAPIFTFRGKIYVRPMGRGICLYDEQGNELGKQLEDALPSELNGYAEVAVWEEKPE